MLVIIAAVAWSRLHGDARWRLHALKQKYDGSGVWYQSLGWPDLLRIVTPGSGFRIEPAMYYDARLEIHNPYSSERDLMAAKVLFQRECGTCHGAAAQGTGAAPALAGASLARAHDDLSTFLVIRQGISGTSMAAHKLEWADTWRLAAYVQSLKAGQTATPGADLGVSVTARDLVESTSRPQDWLTYSGAYNGWRHSPLNGINTKNVEGLQVAWIHHLPGNYTRQQTVPLVANGIMYMTFAPANLDAVDAATGRLLWSFSRPLPGDLVSCCGTVNRGAALLGKRVFLLTMDCHLIALDNASGRVVWERTVANYKDDYTCTGAPLAVNDLIVTGVAGAEFATRGHISAFRASDGSPAWRFDTIPGPGQPGNETWEGESWKTGGASSWMTGSFDPATNTIYWGTGNPAPQFFGARRKGDNLYSDSVVALDASTGARKWHFQFTPHDTHGWDAAQVPVLIDKPGSKGGAKLLAWPNRNGFFYSLDARTGAFNGGTAFAKQTWARGLDANGRPIPDPKADPSEQGTLVWPSGDGATAWWPAAYNPDTGLLYVPVLEHSGTFVSNAREEPKKGRSFMGGGVESSSMSGRTMVRALDAVSGRLVWEKPSAERPGGSMEIGGLLSTAGGVVFGSDGSEIQAIDASTGKVLWRFDTGAQVMAPPISYSVNGRQFIAVAAGNVMLAFAREAGAR